MNTVLLFLYFIEIWLPFQYRLYKKTIWIQLLRLETAVERSTKFPFKDSIEMLYLHYYMLLQFIHILQMVCTYGNCFSKCYYGIIYGIIYNFDTLSDETIYTTKVVSIAILNFRLKNTWDICVCCKNWFFLLINVPNNDIRAWRQIS